VGGIAGGRTGKVAVENNCLGTYLQTQIQGLGSTSGPYNPTEAGRSCLTRGLAERETTGRRGAGGAVERRDPQSMAGPGLRGRAKIGVPFFWHRLLRHFGRPPAAPTGRLRPQLRCDFLETERCVGKKKRLTADVPWPGKTQVTSHIQKAETGHVGGGIEKRSVGGNPQLRPAGYRNRRF